MTDTPLIQNTVTVYFTDSESDYWCRQFLKPGFTHCFAVVGDIVVNPCFHFVYVGRARGPYEHTERIDIDFIEPAHVSMSPFRPVTCVEIVKRLLGINDWRVMTPYQLYTRLNHG